MRTMRAPCPYLLDSKELSDFCHFNKTIYLLYCLAFPRTMNNIEPLFNMPVNFEEFLCWRLLYSFFLKGMTVLLFLLLIWRLCSVYSRYKPLISSNIANIFCHSKSVLPLPMFHHFSKKSLNFNQSHQSFVWWFMFLKYCLRSSFSFKVMRIFSSTLYICYLLPRPPCWVILK